MPTLNSERICLRSICDDDIDGLYTVFSNPEVMRYWSTPPLPDRKAAVQLLGQIQASIASESIMKWAIALRSTNELIGTTTLFNFQVENQRAELGYALGRAHWGKGFMHEALLALLAQAFDVMELRRLEADVDPRNTASIKTLERLGFSREGFLRERWNVNGEIQDAFFYGLLKREWKRAS